MGVAEEVNKSEKVGQTADEKVKETTAKSVLPATQVPQQEDKSGKDGIGGGGVGVDMMVTPEQQEAAKTKLLTMEDLTGPQDKVIPKTSQKKDVGIGPSKEVPQQTDKGKDGI